MASTLLVARGKFPASKDDPTANAETSRPIHFGPRDLTIFARDQVNEVKMIRYLFVSGSTGRLKSKTSEVLLLQGSPGSPVLPDHFVEFLDTEPSDQFLAGLLLHCPVPEARGEVDAVERTHTGHLEPGATRIARPFAVAMAMADRHDAASCLPTKCVVRGYGQGFLQVQQAAGHP